MTEEAKAEVRFLLAQMKDRAAQPAEINKACDLIEALVMEPAVPFHAFERPRVAALPDGGYRFY